MNDGSCDPFYVDLKDDGNGDSPSEAQFNAMWHNIDKINNAMRVYGGSEMFGFYWLNDGWYGNIIEGGISNVMDPPGPVKTRGVTPLP